VCGCEPLQQMCVCAIVLCVVVSLYSNFARVIVLCVVVSLYSNFARVIVLCVVVSLYRYGGLLCRLLKQTVPRKEKLRSL